MIKKVSFYLLVTFLHMSPLCWGQTQVLLAYKHKPTDHPKLQEAGHKAMDLLEQSFKTALPNATISRLDPKDTSIQTFLTRLEIASKAAGPDGTLIVYTHSHGFKNNPKRMGGLALGNNKEEGILPWGTYAKILANLENKNIIVLTMACFSGNLIEALNSKGIKLKLAEKNFLVMTSQDSLQASKPISINSTIINPFTYSIISLIDDPNIQNLEIQEFAQVIKRTRDAKSDNPRFENTANPQLTGDYKRGELLFKDL
jgi:hypothetical protein